MNMFNVVKVDFFYKSGGLFLPRPDLDVDPCESGSPTLQKGLDIILQDPDISALNMSKISV